LSNEIRFPKPKTMTTDTIYLLYYNSLDVDVWKQKVTQKLEDLIKHSNECKQREIDTKYNEAIIELGHLVLGMLD